MLLFIHNQQKLCCWKFSPSTSECVSWYNQLVNGPLGGSDVGRVIYSECYKVACSVCWAEHIMRLYHSINTDTAEAHNKTCRLSTWRLGQTAHTFLIHLVWNAFPTLSEKHSTLNLYLPLMRKCSGASVCEREGWRPLYQCFVNCLDALHTCAIGVVLKIVYLLFRMSLHPSKRKKNKM